MKPLHWSDTQWEEIQEIASLGICEKCQGPLGDTWSLVDGLVTCASCTRIVPIGHVCATCEKYVHGKCHAHHQNVEWDWWCGFYVTAKDGDYLIKANAVLETAKKFYMKQTGFKEFKATLRALYTNK